MIGFIVQSNDFVKEILMTYPIGYRSLRDREAAPLAADESMSSK